MPLSDHLTRTPKANVIITTVDPTQRDVRGIDVHGDEHMLAIYDLRGSFRWPVEGETWTIYQENGTWFLGWPWQGPDTLPQIETLKPGEGIIGGPESTYFLGTSLKTSKGAKAIFIKGDPGPGNTVIWDDTTKNWIPGVAATGGSDVNWVWTQSTPSAVWSITHPLNKFPSVTIVDSSGNQLFASVKFIDLSHITISFAGTTAGSAYLN